MNRAALAALLLLAAACKKAPPASPDEPPTVATVAGERLIDYDGPKGLFRCRAPAEWKALEFDDRTPSVMLAGTIRGPLRGKVAISITYYDGANDPVTTPQAYWDGLKVSGQKPSPLETRTAGGRTVYALHAERPQHPPHGWKVLWMNREDTVLVPAKKGFFALTHSAPADAYAQTLPVFEALVASFDPKGS